MRYLHIILLLFIGCSEKIDQSTLDKFESTKLTVEENIELCADVKASIDEFSNNITKTKLYYDYDDEVSLIMLSGNNSDYVYLNFSTKKDKYIYVFKGSSYIKVKFDDGEVLVLKCGEDDFTKGGDFSVFVSKKSDYYKLRTKKITYIRFVGGFDEDFVTDAKIENQDLLIKNLQCFDNPFLP
tara:strand:+ start:1692 stop:2240 length:549 start_codon:yes stop_codon:yes gene_type:complete